MKNICKAKQQILFHFLKACINNFYVLDTTNIAEYNSYNMAYKTVFPFEMRYACMEIILKKMKII